MGLNIFCTSKIHSLTPFNCTERVHFTSVRIPEAWCSAPAKVCTQRKHVNKETYRYAWCVWLGWCL